MIVNCLQKVEIGFTKELQRVTNAVTILEDGISEIKYGSASAENIM